MSITIVQSSGPTVETLVDEIVELIQERELQIGDQLPPIRELAKLIDINRSRIETAQARTKEEMKRYNEGRGDLTDVIVRQSVERVEAIAWEVIPQMAETLIREEIRRLQGEPPEDG